MAKSQNKESVNWRKRYLQQGDEFDGLKNRYREHVELLQRILSRLCMTTDEANDDFQREIRELRKKLKGELTSLPGLAESLADIDQLLLTQQEQEESLRVSLPDNTGTVKTEASLWKRLKRRISPSRNSDTAKNEEDRIEVVPEDFVELPGADKLKEVLESTPGYGAIASKVADILNNLLSQLSYPESAQKDLQALRLRIASRVNWYELPPTLEDTSSLIISSLGKGQRQFDSFLHQLDQQLESMLEFLEDHDGRDQSWIELSKQLHDAIHEQKIAFEDTEAASLSHIEAEQKLKRSIELHLEQISDTTIEFVKRGEKLKEGFKPQLENMKQRVNRLAEEQKVLREKLKEERAQALIDILTKLPNREAYDERLEFEYVRWARYRKPVVLVAGDIDGFQDINERYGHLSGDRTLQIIAKELRQRIRKTDFIARYGGEEFVFILPLTELPVAEQVIEKLRQTVSQLPFHFRAQRVQLTMSFGLVEFHEVKSFSDLTACAEQALNAAKEAGRNCIRSWSPPEADNKQT